ncbi:MAG: hypothetical protein B6244_01595 [Candidatus Cloacimonetes bacterium 4572_55]|nr:MAG: hypothetical protein B6244_01595 [Candidatus Cloacimonetes bacterium 4572_55]
MKRLRDTLVIISCLSIFAAGCATHPESLSSVEQALRRGDFIGADTLMQQQTDLEKGKDRLLFYLHSGLTAHLSGKYAQSNHYFDLADDRFDELYTKSISTEVASFISNELVKPYSGEDFEKVTIHYYMALNYLLLGELDEALVECRRVNVKLEEFNRKYDDNPNVYRADAFIHYLMGLIYEASGDLNNSFIAYRNAAKVYEEDYLEFYGLDVPEQLKEDILRTAQALGFQSQVDFYEAKWNKSDRIPQSLHRGSGELVLIWDNGLAPHKTQNSIEIPFEDYYLRAAFPSFVSRPPNLSYASANVGIGHVKTEIFQDIDAIAIKNLEDRQTRIIAKTAARGVAKYAVKEKIENEFGEAAGCVFNVFAAATEQADTRSWFTLPHNIQIARLLHAPGQYDVHLHFYGASGQLIFTDMIPDVSFQAGRMTFVTYRTFR